MVRVDGHSKRLVATIAFKCITLAFFLMGCSTEITTNKSGSFPHWIPVLIMILVALFFFVILPPIAKRKKELRIKKELDEYMACVERHSMGCNKCGNIVDPKYISLGTGRHRSEELWKYVCDNCGRSWKEYWPMGS